VIEERTVSAVVGQTVSALRQAAGLTQAELAAAMREMGSPGSDRRSPPSWRVGSMNDVALGRRDDPPLRTIRPPPREIAGRLHRVLRKPRTLPLHLKSLPSGDPRERF
jgi:transcriptional regulator with XRE-family HTH domain